jgi:hypothetical protein
MDPLESKPNPEAYKTVQKLVQEVQDMIIDVYGLEGTTNAADKLWDGSDEELKVLIRRDLLPDAGTYPILQSSEFLGSIIHFPQNMIEKLAHSSARSRLTGDCLPEMLALIEETSHYTYHDSYRQMRNGQSPHSANIEMIGVIDKFNILLGLHQKSFGEGMDIARQAESIYQNAVVSEQSWPGDRPAEYIVGHELGIQYVDLLNGLHNQGTDTSSELNSFYRMSNQAQMEYLFYDLEFSVDARSPSENEGIGKAFQEIGLGLRNQ